jgi:hypothetical protein
MAAVVAWAGMDPIAFLLEDDPFKVALMARAASRAFELQQALNEELALKIINTLSKAMKG